MEKKGLLSEISENLYFQCLKMTFADLVPFLIGVNVLYFVLLIAKVNAINLLLLVVGLIYCVAVNIEYGYHYAQLHKEKPQLYIFFSLLMSFIFIYSDSVGDSIRLVLPVLLINMIGIDLMHKASELKLHFSKRIPIFFEEYMSQLLPTISGLAYILLMIHFKNMYIPILQIAIDFIFNFLSSIVGTLLVVFLTCYSWRKGTHGVAVLGGLLRPFWMNMIMYNLMCVMNQQPAVYISTEAFYQWFVWIGGSGTTLGLTFLCRYLAKSSQLKKIGQNAFVSGLFNVNEEVIFGLPIVGNDYFKVPFYLAPLTCATLTYFLMYLGYIGKTFLLAPWVLPNIIGSVWVTGGQLRIVIYAVFLFVLSTILYYPFFKAYDRSLCKEEHNK